MTERDAGRGTERQPTGVQPRAGAGPRGLSKGRGRVLLPRQTQDAKPEISVSDSSSEILHR